MGCRRIRVSTTKLLFPAGQPGTLRVRPAEKITSGEEIGVKLAWKRYWIPQNSTWLQKNPPTGLIVPPIQTCAKGKKWKCHKNRENDLEIYQKKEVNKIQVRWNVYYRGSMSGQAERPMVGEWKANCVPVLHSLLSRMGQRKRKYSCKML